MKTKTIFKTLAMAMLMPAMLLTTACSNQDDVVNTENTANIVKKGYALPVTVNVTRQGDEGNGGNGVNRRAEYTYNSETGKGRLSFSAGDKLFVQGIHDDAGLLAGALTWQSGETFTGTIYTEKEYSGTIEALLSEGELQAILLPNGYEEYGYWYIEENNSEALYDDFVDCDGSKAFALTKATAVEQFSNECAYYESSCFALKPVNVIANFTITGLTANKEVDVLLTHPYGTRTISGKVTTDGSGNATFAVGLLRFCETFSNVSLTVDGNEIILGNHAIEAGHIYNITRSSAPATDLSMLDCAGNARASRWTANCYMVHTAGNYKLPLVYGNAIKNGATNVDAYTGVTGTNTTATFPRHDGSAITAPWIKDNGGTTVKSAELVWQDAEGLVTAVGISGDYLTLIVGKNATTQEGNAVVAAKDSKGKVVWSWHIWVTNQTFTTLASVNTGSHIYQVTPVNLGWVGDATSATGTSTFYQWGRKDPFPGTGDVTYSEDIVGIADNIKKPGTFYNSGASSKPNGSTAINLWDAQQTSTSGNIATPTVKTVYDPCPAGFCVPTVNLYHYIRNGGVSFSWVEENKGRNLASVTPNVFFPATDFRNQVSGTFNGVSYTGYYWSASAISGNGGYNLGFSSSDFYWDNSYRAAGFPVRAVAEE